MNKAKAIRILTLAAAAYKNNLEDQEVMFLYGVPADIKKFLQKGVVEISAMNYYETVFLRRNFLHLTGVKLNKEKIKSSINFYEKCLDHRIAEDDFEFASDGSTQQKLEIIEQMMNLKKNVAMIGDFTDRGPTLYAQKAAGTIFGCIGFLKDSEFNKNVPNTLLNKDIRDVISRPANKIYVVLSKHFGDLQYKTIEKIDKDICLRHGLLPAEIEMKISADLMDEDDSSIENSP